MDRYVKQLKLSITLMIAIGVLVLRMESNKQRARELGSSIVKYIALYRVHSKEEPYLLTVTMKSGATFSTDDEKLATFAGIRPSAANAAQAIISWSHTAKVQVILFSPDPSVSYYADSTNKKCAVAATDMADFSPNPPDKEVVFPDWSSSAQIPEKTSYEGTANANIAVVALERYLKTERNSIRDLERMEAIKAASSRVVIDVNAASLGISYTRDGMLLETMRRQVVAPGIKLPFADLDLDNEKIALSIAQFAGLIEAFFITVALNGINSKFERGGSELFLLTEASATAPTVRVEYFQLFKLFYAAFLAAALLMPLYPTWLLCSVSPPRVNNFAGFWLIVCFVIPFPLIAIPGLNYIVQIFKQSERRDAITDIGKD